MARTAPWRTGAGAWGYSRKLFSRPLSLSNQFTPEAVPAQIVPALSL